MIEKYWNASFPWEAAIWFAGLIAVAIPDPTAVSEWTLCIFEHMGLPFCPGCGLGHAIGYLVRGAFAASFAAHPLGVPVAVLLITRASNLVLDWRKQEFR